MRVSEIAEGIHIGRRGRGISRALVEELLRELLTVLNTYSEGEVLGFIRRYSKRRPRGRG